MLVSRKEKLTSLKNLDDNILKEFHIWFNRKSPQGLLVKDFQLLDTITCLVAYSLLGSGSVVTN